MRRFGLLRKFVKRGDREYRPAYFAIEALDKRHTEDAYELHASDAIRSQINEYFDAELRG